MPSWVDPFLNDDVEQLQQKFSAIFDLSIPKDRYLLWTFQQDAFPNPEQALLQWRSHAQSLFSEMKTLWFPKRKEKDSDETL